MNLESLESRRLLSASTDPAIARWDTVPAQTFTSVLDAGVVAFQAGGIASVDFIVNNGPETVVNRSTLNPQTGVWEYVLPLTASNYADGAIQVAATAIPVVGTPRVLPTITLWADAHGSLPTQFLYVSTAGSDTAPGTASAPLATIQAAATLETDGGTIYLAAGTYPFTGRNGYNENSRWITLEPAPGVAQSAVTIVPAGVELRVYDLALENLTIDGTVGYDISGWNYADNNPDSIWLDNCSVSSPTVPAGDEIGEILSDAWTHEYVTNTTIHDYAGRGMVGVDLSRGDTLENLGDDAIDQPGLVVNTKIDNVYAINPGEHIDALQWWSPTTSPTYDADSIIYGVTATRVDGQLFFGNGDNVAAVNYFGLSTQGGIADADMGQWIASDNLYMDHVELPNQAFSLNDTTGSITNATIQNSLFYRLFATDRPDESIAECHITDLSAYLEFVPLPVDDCTSGNAGFVNNSSNPANADFTDQNVSDYLPAVGGELIIAGMAPDVPIDVAGTMRTTPDSIGALASPVAPVVVTPPVIIPPVIVPPVAPPILAYLSAPIETGGHHSELITVKYVVPGGINLASLGSSNLVVTGPNGYASGVTLVSAKKISATTVTAVYRLNAPVTVEGWNWHGNGVYDVNLQGDQVRDNSGNFAPAQLLGTFTVRVR